MRPQKSLGSRNILPACSAEKVKQQLGAELILITTEVRDARRMAHGWGSGVLSQDMMTLLHRVVFYGDHFESARDLCTLMRLNLVEEG